MMTLVRSTIAAVALSGLAGMPMAWAQDASGWDTQAHTAVRLIAGAMIKTPEAAFLRAGIEIKLDPGWKTYWRDPGDSGVPPTFDFADSDNVKSVTVLWPAPERFSDGAGGDLIGYVDHVILPLQVAPQDAAKQTSLHLKLGYAICGNLCVPVEADLTLALNGDGAEEAAIERADIRVPRRVPLGRQATVSPFSPCIASRESRTRASWSTSPRRRARRSICLPRGRRPIGRCRCRNRRPAPAPRVGSASISTVCRPMRRLRVRRLRSPRFPATAPSRSRPISTNSPAPRYVMRRETSIP